MVEGESEESCRRYVEKMTALMKELDLLEETK